jgi:ribose 1,5-bisphosphate isomerase
MDFNQIIKDIKGVKIQGAENIAIAAVKAYHLRPNQQTIKILESLRPTEPCLRNALKFVSKSSKNITLALKHFQDSNKKIIEYGTRKIKDDMVIFTHCHSSTVIKILKAAKKQKKNFQVYNTETRPLLQGRITAKELAKSKIPVTHFVDSAARLAVKESDLVLLGADSITVEGKVINKIGSEMVSEIANRFNIPVYICTNSWKFDPKTLFGFEEKIEKRYAKEVWPDAPEGVKINNMAFEKINPDLITGIISELGISAPEIFIEEVKQNYPWMFK